MRKTELLKDILRTVRDHVFAITHPADTVDVHGIRLTLDNASPRMRYVMHKGYESEDAELVSQILTSDDVVLEAGSATGFLSIHCLKKIGVRSITMVEANPEMIPVIRKNFLLNEMSSPLIIQAAVAEKDGELSFGINRNFWSSSTIRRAGERRVTVPAKSIPTLIASMEQRPTALIMDIEGGEARIPLDHLLLFDKIVMETHRKLVGNEPIDRILRQLAGNGFKEIARIGGSIAFRRS